MNERSARAAHWVSALSLFRVLQKYFVKVSVKVNGKKKLRHARKVAETIGKFTRNVFAKRGDPKSRML